MKIKLLIFFVLILSETSFSQNNKINGISFVGGRNVVTEASIKPVINVNANWVCLMPFGFMQSLNTTQISFNRDRQWWGERKVGVRNTSALFHNAGVKVMVKPQIWISRGAFTGHIGMKTEDEWKLFESAYEQFILEYAVLAQEIKAELFCIGTELNKFVTERPQFWEKLIAKVRKVYKGKLTYAENWDTFDKVHFWKKLDYIGVDAYFPLSGAQTPGIEEMEKGWDRHKSEIAALQQKENKPVLFTEYGYRSVDFAARQPWNSDRSMNSVNLKAQENALKAIYNKFWDEDWFAGGFLWKWYDFHHRAGGTSNSRFTPQNKPAEKLIQEFYGTYQ